VKYHAMYTVTLLTNMTCTKYITSIIIPLATNVPRSSCNKCYITYNITITTELGTILKKNIKTKTEI